jgi:hypothetical protein
VLVYNLIKMDRPTDREMAEAIACTLEHRRNPDVTYADYRQHAFADLETLLRGRILIYLDTKYWVWLRQPNLAGKSELAVKRLFELLRAGVKNGLFICPVAFPTVSELFKQHDVSRLATASIVDELSLGVSLKAPREIDMVEWISLFRQLADQSALGYSEPVWTKVGLLFAENILEAELRDAPDVAGAKRAFNAFWTRPMTEVSSSTQQIAGLPNFGERINHERAAKPRGDLTYKQLSFIELYTAADQKRETILKAMIMAAGSGKTKLESPPEDTWAEFLRQMCLAALRSPAGQRLPYQRTVSAVHASIRMNDEHLHETNDLADAMHAGGALAYCDVFLTERSLAKCIERDVKGVVPSECQVESQPDAAVAHLEQLAANLG